MQNSKKVKKFHQNPFFSYSAKMFLNVNLTQNLLPGGNEQIIRDVNGIDKPAADGGIFTKGNRLEICNEENGRIDAQADLNMQGQESPSMLDLIDTEEPQHEKGGDGKNDTATATRVSEEQAPTALYLDEQQSDDDKNLDDLIGQKMILRTEKLVIKIFNYLGKYFL
jgi:hypothetical protein